MTWQEKLKEKFWRIKAAERATGLQHHRRQFKAVESLVYDTRRKLLGGDSSNMPEDDEMIVGDVTVTNLPNKSSGLAKTALLSAGIAAAGASAGFGPAIVAALTSDKVTERVETKTEVIEGESSSERLEIGEPIIRRPEGR